MTADFNRLLDILTPSREGIVAMLEAYFDESGRDGGILAVAGYAFAKEQAKRFSKEWSTLFAEYGGCHMSELAAGNGRFRSAGQAERVRLCKEAVKIINRRVSFGIAVSCHLDEMDRYLPKWVRGFEHAYPVCCHMAAIMMGRQVKASSMDGEVAYFFEAGHQFAPSAHFLMHYAQVSPDMRLTYRYGAHAFIQKEVAIPLQAADMFAWEWAKYRDETVIQRQRAMRKSLAALFSVPGPNGEPILDTRRYHLSHLEGDALKRFCQGIAGLAVPAV